MNIVGVHYLSGGYDNEVYILIAIALCTVDNPTTNLNVAVKGHNHDCGTCFHQMSVNAYAALLSQFAKASGISDRLIETCPMRLTSKNALAVRDLIATVMVSMANWATWFRRIDQFHIRSLNYRVA